MHKVIGNLEIVHGLNFDFVSFFKSNGTKYVLMFDLSCDEICNSKAFVGFAAVGKHHGLSSSYNQIVSPK